MLENQSSPSFFLPLTIAPPTAASPPSPLSLTRPLSSLGFSKLEAVAGARCPSVTAARCHGNGRQPPCDLLRRRQRGTRPSPSGGGGSEREREGGGEKNEERNTAPPHPCEAKERDCQIWRRASSSSPDKGITKTTAWRLRLSPRRRIWAEQEVSSCRVQPVARFRFSCLAGGRAGSPNKPEVTGQIRKHTQ